MAQQQSFEVTLEIYDLSKGMARQLSAQFLGPQYAVDAIPHTGVFVYGREYFYGGGIQSEDPDFFRRSTGMYPIDSINIGVTAVTREEFENWCRSSMRSGSYTASSYDLLRRNCNNFCYDAIREGLQMPDAADNLFPKWILEVPRKFLSSPMGQLVRPMLENMQLSGVVEGAEPVGRSAAPPFANAAPSLLSNAGTSAENAATSASTSNGSSNPWATMKPAVTTSTAPTNDNKATAATGPTGSGTTGICSTPCLDSFDRPLLSSDTKMVKLCVAKLLPGLAESDEGDDDKTRRQYLEEAGRALQQNEELDADLAAKTCETILRCCFERGYQITFAMLLLRVVVLKSPSPSCWTDCMTWIIQQLSSGSSDDDGGSSSLASPAARSAAWLIASNAFGKSCLHHSSSLLESLIDAAAGDITEGSQPRVEVRQAASSFLYNVALVKGAASDDDGDGEDTPLSDLLVSLLCSTLEGVDTEPDSTCRLRRLIVIGRILKPLAAAGATSTSHSNKSGGGGSCRVRQSAKGLVADLGYDQALENAAWKGSSCNGPDREECKKLALELLHLVRQ